MADYNKMKSELKADTYVLSGTTQTDVGYVDMRDYETILVALTRARVAGGNSGLDKFQLIASSGSAGGNPVVMKTLAATGAINASGESAFLELNVKELVDEDPVLRYVSARVDHKNAADVSTLTYLRGHGKASRNQTSDAS